MGMIAKRDALVLDHLPLVRRMAYSLRRKWSWAVHFDAADLISAGTIGLIEAAQYWVDHGGSGQFVRLASPKIWWAIRHEMQPILGQGKDSPRRQIARVGTMLHEEQQHHHDPTDRTLAGIDAATILSTLSPYDQDVLGWEGRGDLEDTADKYGKTYLAVKMRRHKLRKILKETYVT